MLKRISLTANVVFVAMLAVFMVKFDVFSRVMDKFADGHWYFQHSVEEEKRARDEYAKLLYERYDHNVLHKETSPQVVMLGDSLTYCLDWSAVFPEISVVSRAVPGLMSDEINKLIHESIQLNPKYVFIMVGINDFYQDKEPGDVVKNVLSAAFELQRHGVTQIVQSVLHVTALANSKKGGGKSDG